MENFPIIIVELRIIRARLCLAGNWSSSPLGIKIYGQIMEKPLLTPPFFLFEDVSLDIFQGLSELEKKIEPQDLMDDVYRAFDSVGNILNFRIVEKEQKGFWVSTKIKTVVFDSADMSSDDLFLKCLQSSYKAYFETEPAGLDKRQLMKTLIQKCGFSC
ncbi:hypothetical protein BN21_0442 [Neisseria meningitidis alpha704]|nr:hypothetical protein BN21_0442 [Neisseria meningitidis alpha704]